MVLGLAFLSVATFPASIAGANVTSRPCGTLTPYVLSATYATGSFTGLFCVNANGDGTYTQYSPGLPVNQQTLTGTGHIRMNQGVTSIQAHMPKFQNLNLVGTTNGTTSSFGESGSGFPHLNGTFILTPANDVAVLANLRNGVPYADAYQVNQGSFSGILAGLQSIDPSVSWTAATTSCTASEPTCISVGSVDVATAGDQQGAIFAAMSNTGNCYWIANLQANPAVVASTGFLLNATVGQPGNESLGNTPTTLTSAGLYYAEKSGPGAAAACNAAYPMTASAGFNWGSSLSAPGSAG